MNHLQSLMSIRAMLPSYLDCDPNDFMRNPGIPPKDYGEWLQKHHKQKHNHKKKRKKK